MAITVSSGAFSPGGPIPKRHSQDGDNVSPALAWEGLPQGTEALALVVDDPDAPRAEPWVHWVIYHLRGDAEGLPEAVTQGAQTGPAGAIQGPNSAGHLGWDGPAPPHGHGIHHYHFTLYALAGGPLLPPGMDKARLVQAIQGRILGKGEVVGTYER
jgi:Raf kinase inhibitor-like YbhB/YbcL family protein